MSQVHFREIFAHMNGEYFVWTVETKQRETKYNRILRGNNSAPLTGDLSPEDVYYVDSESIGYYLKEIARVFGD